MKKFLLVPALAVPFLLASCGQTGSSGNAQTQPSSVSSVSSASANGSSTVSSGPSSYKGQRQADTKTSAS